MTEGKLRAAEQERVNFTFSMYESEGKVDAIDLPVLLRGMNFNPTLKKLEELGATVKPGLKYFTVEEITEMYRELKKNLKNMGTKADFAEVLSMMDKNENGKIPLAEIAGLLGTLGEPLDDSEMNEVLKDCMPQENDEGDVDFMPFLAALCATE